jgi:Fe2+ or Zn2+ uptake regulation protein
MHGSHARSVVLLCLLNSEDPVSARELHYAVKQVDFNVCLEAVYATLRLIVAAGMATAKGCLDGAIRYSHQLTTQPRAGCKHEHLVCRDCGAEVNAPHPVEGQDNGSNTPAVY